MRMPRTGEPPLVHERSCRSWQRGDRRHPAVPDQFYGNVGRAFAANGLVGLVMSYRLAPGVQHPEQVRDVAREKCPWPLLLAFVLVVVGFDGGWSATPAIVSGTSPIPRLSFVDRSLARERYVVVLHGLFLVLHLLA